MSTNPPRSRQLPRTCPRVHGDLFTDNEAIGDELADGLAGVGVGDFADFVGIEPDLSLTAAGNRGCEALLSA